MPAGVVVVVAVRSPVLAALGSRSMIVLTRATNSTRRADVGKLLGLGFFSLYSWGQYRMSWPAFMPWAREDSSVGWVNTSVGSLEWIACEEVELRLIYIYIFVP